MSSLTSIGKRLDSIVRYILDNYPEDKWIISNVVPMFLEAINSTTTIQEEQLIIDKLNKLIDLYEFRYNKIFELIREKTKETLRTWFKRKGAPGKTGGWVDCNAPIRKDGKIVGYKPCGRQKGEKRAYPACRPTPSKCKAPGKGKNWGKKSK
jgi:hypothetical protein